MKRTIIVATLIVAAPVLYAQAAETNRSQPTAAEQVSQGASDAWKWLKKESYAAWDATTKAFNTSIETRKTLILNTELPAAISGKRLLGTSLENGRDGKVGAISDLVFGGDSRLDAVVVSEGGFLGIGAEQVPMKPNLITIRRQPDGVRPWRHHGQPKAWRCSRRPRGPPTPDGLSGLGRCVPAATPLG